MDCKIDANLLQDYLEGTIEPLDKIIIEEHLKLCSDCRNQLLTLKLLFWELDELAKTRIEIPSEVPEIREKILSSLFAGSYNSMSLQEVLELQKKTIANAGMFIRFIPGARTGESYLKKGLSKTPAAAFALSGNILKGGFKLLQTRFLS